MLPWWLKHYGSFCEKLVVYDDHSDDDSVEIAQAGGAEVRPYPGNGLDDIEMIELACRTYPEARGQADWVVWSDTDEFIYHPRISDRLAQLHADGVSAPSIIGYSMFSDTPPHGPGQIYEHIQTGIFDHNYSKQVLFNPILDMQWSVGKHMVSMSANAVRDNASDPIKLLHYRWLGKAYFEARNAQNYARRSQRNIDNHMGDAVIPNFAGDHSVLWFEQRVAEAKPCV